jgi:hypothetical protein
VNLDFFKMIFYFIIFISTLLLSFTSAQYLDTILYHSSDLYCNLPLYWQRNTFSMDPVFMNYCNGIRNDLCYNHRGKLFNYHAQVNCVKTLADPHPQMIQFPSDYLTVRRYRDENCDVNGGSLFTITSTRIGQCMPLNALQPNKWFKAKCSSEDGGMVSILECSTGSCDPASCKEMQIANNTCTGSATGAYFHFSCPPPPPAPKETQEMI